MLNFGLENGQDCYCGKNAPEIIPCPENECNTPCAGDESEFCGGSWRLSLHVYYLGLQSQGIANGDCVQGIGSKRRFKFSI